MTRGVEYRLAYFSIKFPLETKNPPDPIKNRVVTGLLYHPESIMFFVAEKHAAK